MVTPGLRVDRSTSGSKCRLNCPLHADGFSSTVAPTGVRRTIVVDGGCAKTGLATTANRPQQWR